MSIDLRGAGGALKLSYPAWLNLLLLAERGGWEPAGTKSELYLEAAFVVGFETAEELERCPAMHDTPPA
jgi:hypothetical protein